MSTTFRALLALPAGAAISTALVNVNELMPANFAVAFDLSKVNCGLPPAISSRAAMPAHALAWRENFASTDRWKHISNTGFKTR
jgi:hypothetical protein